MAKGKQACISFLEKNGFVKTDVEIESYANDYCNVVFEDQESMILAFNDGTQFFAKPNIYFLIGWLTYYNHINRDFKI